MMNLRNMIYILTVKRQEDKGHSFFDFTNVKIAIVEIFNKKPANRTNLWCKSSWDDVRPTPDVEKHINADHSKLLFYVEISTYLQVICWLQASVITGSVTDPVKNQLLQRSSLRCSPILGQKAAEASKNASRAFCLR